MNAIKWSYIVSRRNKKVNWVDLKIAKMELFKFFILISVIYYSNALSDRDLFNINAPGSTILERGNDNSKLVNLQNPINFYTEKYDSIYVSLTK